MFDNLHFSRAEKQALYFLIVVIFVNNVNFYNGNIGAKILTLTETKLMLLIALRNINTM